MCDAAGHALILEVLRYGKMRVRCKSMGALHMLFWKKYVKNLGRTITSA